MNKYSFIIIVLLCLNNIASATIQVSHKGVWRDFVFPQNSSYSIQGAVENGFEGVEFDVFMTRDKVFILAHDDSLLKVTNCRGKISESFYKEIQNCIVKKSTLLPITKILLKKVKNPKRLTRLDEVLEKLSSAAPLKLVWIDLKQQNIAVVEPLVETISTYASEALKDSIVINNGSTNVLRKFKNIFPDVRYSLEGKWGSEPLVDTSFIKNAGVTHDIISLNVGFRLGDESPLKIIGKKKRFLRRLERLITNAKIHNIPVIGWTVNKKEKLKDLLNYDLDFLLTDRVKPIN
ncbi:glycerophosphodiester phosphodiesterase family protein [Bacteriovorax sp. Seq25_V]|uniref:glycerophosphodiester phosphodiesterase n=1 Tax=Bacteriovorax sp. Seq25_V TaxID=1201288 RepID=UPI00038A3C84|nr:glycerophosphodiester phosphodiesterase family protein [Bacteriovorax sp. Seq25_V]EQC46811.1 glycerophosphodiester phosphodiesterase family protein [Bacteriovorax sp. Seq25_V]